MMQDFLRNNREELETRCVDKATLRPAHVATAQQLSAGVPLFLDQLIRTLEAEQAPAGASDSQRISGPSGGGSPAFSEMGVGAAEHGRQLFTLGFSIDQLVHGYGDLCQAITDLAVERDAPFEVSEFRTLNRCLDTVMADAVTEYGYQRDKEVGGEHVSDTRHQLKAFAHELRALTKTATLAFTALKTAQLGLGGSTGSLLERSLVGVNSLLDTVLMEPGTPPAGSPDKEAFRLDSMIADLRPVGALEAQTTGHRFIASEVDPRLAVHADRELIFSAVVTLLQNAFRFSRPQTEVNLNAYASGDRILIDVRDSCGGLEPGDAEKMFLPFASTGKDKMPPALGLAIARRGVESAGGTLTVRDVAGEGCILSISLPRYTASEAMDTFTP